MLNAPASFVEGVLWPEFQEINSLLREYLEAATERIIQKEVFGESGEAVERPDAG
jgi:hypothetical protein